MSCSAHVEEPEPKPEPEKEVLNEEPRNETDDEKAATQNPQNVETKVEDNIIEPKVELPKEPVIDQVFFKGSPMHNMC